MTDASFPYRGGVGWLRDRTILLARHGSHAYGLDTPQSDLDMKGVVIPPRAHFLGFAHKFEQAEQHDPDFVVYDIRKFFSLAADCNPSIIEVLWANPEDYLVLTEAGKKLVDARAAFLSRKAKHTFSGYAISQLKRINLHHRWLRNPPTHKPTRAEYGLPERTLIPADQLAAAASAVEKKLGHWNLEDMSGIDPATRIEIKNAVAEMMAEIGVSQDEAWRGAARVVGHSENFIRSLDMERQYKARLTEWNQYENWRATRNPARHALEAQYGYDTKHAMHLVRLMRMCREILETGKVVVKRPDREELLSIRNGAWSYDKLIEWAAAEDKAMGDLYPFSPLPHAPDRAALDALCVDLVELGPQAPQTPGDAGAPQEGEH